MFWLWPLWPWRDDAWPLWPARLPACCADDPLWSRCVDEPLWSRCVDEPLWSRWLLELDERLFWSDAFWAIVPWDRNISVAIAATVANVSFFMLCSLFPRG